MPPISPSARNNYATVLDAFNDTSRWRDVLPKTGGAWMRQKYERAHNPPDPYEPPGGAIQLSPVRTLRERLADATQGLPEQKRQDVASLLEMAPVVGTTMDLQDAAVDLGRGDYLGAGIGLGLTVAGGGKAGALKGAVKKGVEKLAVKAGSKKAEKVAAKLGFDPKEMARRYPELGQQYTTFETDTRKDNFGRLYPTRYQSAEEKAVEKVRKQAQKEINEGNWTRHYDPAQREHVDPANYPMEGNTRWGATPQDPKTYNNYYDMYNTPEGRQRLLQAYDTGAQFPDMKNWYAMKQWEDDYIKDFGVEEGRKRFRRDFAEGMAATTGGSTPTANFLTTQQLNFRRHTGQDPLGWSIDAQYPVGGRYLQGNVDQYNKMINEGAGIDLENPKRFDFSGNFMGHKNMATMDEQMTSGLVPGMNVPKGPSYGVAEDVVHKLGAERGVEPANFQDVAWGGLKRMKEIAKGKDPAKAYTGQPMIDVINEAIWRTHRVTGLPLAEVARRMRAGTIPTYGIGAAVLGGGAAAGLASPPGSREDAT